MLVFYIYYVYLWASHNDVDKYNRIFNNNLIFALITLILIN